MVIESTILLPSGHGADEAMIKELKEKLILANKILDYEKLTPPLAI
jgi:hypothetical protein